ncbi:MAG: DAHL domain-containing protein [Pseudobdellovibrio sp.]
MKFKKYLAIALISFSAFGAVIYFYFHGKSRSTEEHYIFINTLKSFEQAQTNLDTDVLNSRSFLTLDYDTLAQHTEKILDLCKSLQNQKSFAGDEIAFQIDSYCTHIELKISDIEKFKSKNAIIKNSLLYLHKMTTDGALSPQDAKTSSEKTIRARLITHAALAYYLIPSLEAQTTLEFLIYGSPYSSDDSLLSSSISHAKNILANKTVLDGYVTDILSRNKSPEILQKLSNAYLIQHKEDEAATLKYIHLLFITCLLLLFSILYSINALWVAGKRLTNANESLEYRVQQRAMELQKTQSIIIEQQQSLIASAKMSALGEMAGGVAHEINNPLAVISIRAEQLRDCIDEDNINKEFFIKSLDAINKTTDRIAKIVSGLRFFARDGSNMPFVQSSVGSIIEDTFGFCSEKFKSNGVEIKFDAESCTYLSLDCRPIEISQVVLNLLNNSFDAIQDLPKKWVQLEVNDYDSTHIAISVSDSGSGIDKSIQDNIMQPFFTTKEIGKGTGLGLSISSGIVQSHNGKLYIDNNCENTKFVILLPKKQNHEVEKSA